MIYSPWVVFSANANDRRTRKKWQLFKAIHYENETLKMIELDHDSRFLSGTTHSLGREQPTAGALKLGSRKLNEAVS